MRPAIPHRHAKTLRRSDRDIGAEFAGRGNERQRQQVGGDNRKRAFHVQRGNRRPQIAHGAGRGRILQQRAQHLAFVEIDKRIADDQVPAQGFGTGAQHRKRLRMHLAVDEERFCLAVRGALGQRHCFRRGGGFIKQRRVGDIEPGQIADHGLEVEQCLQPALADLGLIRRIGRVPGRILQDVALDHRRQDRPRIALPDQRGEDLVPCRQLAHMRQRFGFA